MREPRPLDRSTDGPPRGSATLPATKLSRPLARAMSTLRQITGMPDYPRYLEHARSHHPECPLLTEREHYDQYIAARYGAGPSRCC